MICGGGRWARGKDGGVGSRGKGGGEGGGGGAFRCWVESVGVHDRVN